MHAIEVPSKKTVKKAGKTLTKDVTQAEYTEAMGVLSQWRSLHSYPINTFNSTLRKKVKRLGFKSPLIAQRLKRTPSIVRKLQRFPDMSLARMQDIGGLRIILSSVDDVYRLHKDIVRTGGRSKHEPLLPPKDYIKEPKQDGYRSLHQVFKYKSDTRPELNGLQIELQIRTKLQHAWATAVETLGMIEQSSFKTGEGTEDFKQFFKLASALFSYHEKQPILAEYANSDIIKVANELLELNQALNIFDKLQGLIVSARHIETTSTLSAEYHLMELDTSKDYPSVNLVAFTKAQFEIAEGYYRIREIEIKDNPNIELVLISAGNIKDIKKAYPNYFLDTQDFIKHLNAICDKVLGK